MKKIFIYFFALLVFGMTSCSEDETTPTFAIEDILGRWNQTSTTIPEDPEFDPSEGCTEYVPFINISESEISEGAECDGVSSSASYEYEFLNGNELSYEIFGLSGKYVITSLSETELTMDLYALGIKSETRTYSKVAEE